MRTPAVSRDRYSGSFLYIAVRKQIILFVQNFLHHRISAVFPDILEVL